MKGNKIYNLALLKLIGAYALFTGIIASVFLFFIVLPQQKSSQPTPQPTPSVSVNTITPTTAPNPQGKFCGGIAAIQCPSGYVCKMDGNYPDAGGSCLKKEGTINCTMEVKLCPNGSSVGRHGPNCAFDPCPKDN